ncbi:hypothetical protein DQ04_13621010, partial [Trypanosoma grayi]|uniref:hypothetical protein n=1 Tax=Trypanosoma grayi TaxID=71804 RepID=UPI0004F3FF45
MGRHTATRSVAAVAIQRWHRRRCEVTRAVRLLALLHVLQHEKRGSGTVAPLLREMAATAPGEVADDNSVNRSTDGALCSVLGLLLELVVAYAERLHTENYTRRLLLERRAAELRTPGEMQALDVILGVQRLPLLPDATLVELITDVRVAAAAGRQQRVWCVRRCLGAAGVERLVGHG